MAAAGVDEGRAIRRELGLQGLAGALVVGIHASDLRGLARCDIEDIETEMMPAVERLVGDPRAVGRPSRRPGAIRSVRNLADPGSIDTSDEDLIILRSRLTRIG